MGEQQASQRMTLEEYFDFDDKSLHKHEFYNGEVFAMAGAMPNHNRIVHNLHLELGSALRGGHCEIFGSDQRLRVVAKGLYTYPDVSVVCNKPAFHDKRSLINPILLIEVLSKSTSDYDHGAKFGSYRTIPSIQEYVMIDSRSVMVEAYRRTALAAWTYTEYLSANDVVPLESVGIEITVADLYRNVAFDEADDEEGEEPGNVREEDIQYA